MKFLLSLIVGIVIGAGLCAVLFFSLVLHSTGQDVSYAELTASPSGQTPPNPLASVSVEYVRIAPALLAENIVVLSTPEPANPVLTQTGFGLPVRLRIPGIGVDSSIEYVGLTPDGTMDITTRPDNVAWFKFGPKPGESGSAVIAGHYGNWKNGAVSVFEELSTLAVGDRVYIDDDRGVTTTFIVRESRLFDPKADATVVFDSHDGKAHLNLITCDGVWDAVSKSYSKRLVMFTDKE